MTELNASGATVSGTSPAKANNAEAMVADSEFYTPPPLAKLHRPGDVLRMRPVTLNLPRAGAAWQILYVSRDVHGEPIPVSGTVITPKGRKRAGEEPVLVYQPSFHGLGGPCAPSQLLAAGTEPDSEQISAVLARGWTVAVVDGHGMGVLGLGPHTFLTGRTAGQVMLDLARAATRIPALHAAEAPILLWGYADGGRAAVWAGGLQPGYAPDLDVRGIAAGAVVTDPGPILRHLDRSPWPGLVLAGLVGLSHAHRHLPLRHVFTDAARVLLADAESASRTQLCERYRHPVVTWCERPDPWNDVMWRHVLNLEITGAAGVPRAPVHLYHGARDALVPVGFGRLLYTDLRAHGVRADWRAYDGAHFRTARTATDDALAQLARDLTDSTHT
ncbi:lipase family protein [Nocardia vaccinii]|uniref:lipase family protein n=1 Tax=Nocardia vaccinii TaxID=1822 RepID=UPI00082BA361|nr:lipase family protein [Nocardia vaccinii]